MSLMSQIKVLTDEDVDAITYLYANSCKYVDYFQRMFGVTDCTQCIYKDFRPDVAAAVRQGRCLGIYNKGVLIGIILAIDWFAYKEDHPVLYNHMFNKDNPITDILERYANQFSDNVTFIFAIGITDGNRCQGFGRKLLRNFIKRFGRKGVIFSDCLYESAQSLWLKEGFHIVDLTEGDNDIKVITRLK